MMDVNLVLLQAQVPIPVGELMEVPRDNASTDIAQMGDTKAGDVCYNHGSGEGMLCRLVLWRRVLFQLQV
jgi:hypothetical protein